MITKTKKEENKTISKNLHTTYLRSYVLRE